MEVGAALREIIERSRTRRMLTGMSPAVAEDFGIDWAASRIEAARPWWQPVDWPALAGRDRLQLGGAVSCRPSFDLLLRRIGGRGYPA